MILDRLNRFSFALWMIAVSVAIFFSGTLFFLPGICGGPGLLGFDNEGAAYFGIGLYLLGMGGFVVGVVLLLSVAVLRLIARGPRDTPA